MILCNSSKLFLKKSIVGSNCGALHTFVQKLCILTSMAAKIKAPERKIPHIDGGWKGVESLTKVAELREQRYTFAEIADGYGCSLRGLYYRIERAQEMKNAPTSEQDRGATTTRMDKRRGDQHDHTMSTQGNN